MNYLAHILLSGEDRKKQIGNFIGDAVKGNDYNNYPSGIRSGILMHRAIDNFTDNHPAVRRAVRSLRPHLGRYSGVVLDIYFDYLLASRFEEFSDIPLGRFSRRFYGTLMSHYRYLPPRMKRFMWHFIGSGRLGRYAYKKGIRESLDIMVHVGRLHINVDSAMEYLTEYEDELWQLFLPFFRELEAFCCEFAEERS